MSTHHDPIVIIGGGLGGLAAAVTLSARGHRALLLEANDWLGGKAAVHREGGYRFDMGPTILTYPTVLRKLWAEAGEDLDDWLDLVRLDTQWRAFYDDGRRLDLVQDVQRMAHNLEAFGPGQGLGEGYRKLVDWSEDLHRISDKYFFWQSVGGIGDMLRTPGAFPGILADLWRIRPDLDVARIMRRYVPDEQAAQLLDHFTQYVGSNPGAAPAVLASIAHMQVDDGVWYPMGGIAQVPEALAGLATKLGAELRTGVGVRRIELDRRGAVCAVHTERGERIPAAGVISNMDAVRTYRELIGGPLAERFVKAEKSEPACSGVVAYLGLDRPYEHLAHHNFVFSRDHGEEFEAIYRRGEPAPDPTVYIAAPAQTDPSVAPPGAEALYLLVHTPYLRDHHDWSKMLPEYREVIFDKLAYTADLHDLEDRIQTEAWLTPQGIHDRYRVLNGAIYGLASHGRFGGALKPANRRADVPGLYLAGGAAHPGPGMPMVMMSGWIAADALDQDARKERSGVGASAPSTPIAGEAADRAA